MKILPVIAIMIFELLSNCPVSSAEHWIPMESPAGTKWFWDGDSAWFDCTTGNGGVNEKMVDEDESSLPRSAVVSVKFYFDDYTAEKTYGYAHIYDASGKEIAMFYDGKHVSYQKGTNGYAYVRTIAHYAMDKGR